MWFAWVFALCDVYLCYCVISKGLRFFCRSSSRSFMKIWKRAAPRILPWGTPDITRFTFQMKSSKTCRFERWRRKSASTSNSRPWTPYAFSLQGRLSCPLGLKSFLMSKREVESLNSLLVLLNSKVWRRPFFWTYRMLASNQCDCQKMESNQTK